MSEKSLKFPEKNLGKGIAISRRIVYNMPWCDKKYDFLSIKNFHYEFYFFEYRKDRTYERT